MTGLIRAALARNTQKKNITVGEGIYANLRCFRLYGDCSTAAILVFQNNEKKAILVFPTNPVEVELFPCVNAFFCSNECAFMLAT